MLSSDMSTITTAPSHEANAASAPSAVDVLVEASKLLSPQQRRDFFDRFTEAWDDEDEPLETDDDGSPLSKEWMEEIQRRVAEDEAGLTRWTDAGEVIRKARGSLNEPA
jgi:hypothetical protein